MQKKTFYFTLIASNTQDTKYNLHYLLEYYFEVY